MGTVKQDVHVHEDDCRRYSHNDGQAVSNRADDISSKTRQVDSRRSSLTFKPEADDNSLIRRHVLNLPRNEVSIAEGGHNLGWAQSAKGVKGVLITAGAATEKADYHTGKHSRNIE